MTTTVHLPGNAIADWMLKKVVAPDGKIVVSAAVLEEARSMLARTKDIALLRDCVESLAMLAHYLGGKLKDVKAGEAVLSLILELAPRFAGALADRSFDRTARSVEAALRGKDRLGAADQKQLEVSLTDKPALAASRFRGAMRG